MSRYFPCPCGGKHLYQKCCMPYHKGDMLPANARELMRSRYCAYALGLTDYVVTTTHPENVHYEQDVEKWKSDIQEFCKNTKFRGLEILEFVDGANQATVTFKASLSQGPTDTGFTERSTFIKEDGRWFYLSGVDGSKPR